MKTVASNAITLTATITQLENQNTVAIFKFIDVPDKFFADDMGRCAWTHNYPAEHCCACGKMPLSSATLHRMRMPKSDTAILPPATVMARDTVDTSRSHGVTVDGATNTVYWVCEDWFGQQRNTVCRVGTRADADSGRGGVVERMVVLDPAGQHHDIAFDVELDGSGRIIFGSIRSTALATYSEDLSASWVRDLYRVGIGTDSTAGVAGLDGSFTAAYKAKMAAEGLADLRVLPATHTLCALDRRGATETSSDRSTD